MCRVVAGGGFQPRMDANAREWKIVSGGIGAGGTPRRHGGTEKWDEGGFSSISRLFPGVTAYARGSTKAVLHEGSKGNEVSLVLRALCGLRVKKPSSMCRVVSGVSFQPRIDANAREWGQVGRGIEFGGAPRRHGGTEKRAEGGFPCMSRLVPHIFTCCRVGSWVSQTGFTRRARRQRRIAGSSRSLRSSGEMNLPLFTGYHRLLPRVVAWVHAPTWRASSPPT